LLKAIQIHHGGVTNSNHHRHLKLPSLTFIAALPTPSTHPLSTSPSFHKSADQKRKEERTKTKKKKEKKMPVQLRHLRRQEQLENLTPASHKPVPIWSLRRRRSSPPPR
jgi:hypothetical protein